MRKRAAIVMILVIICSFAFGEYYEKVKSYQVGPGTVYSYYEEASHPWAIHVTEIDLKNPYITLETKKAADLQLGREGTSSMSSRADVSGHRVVSAVNGDFYNTSNGQPVNNQIVNGEFVQGFTKNWTAFTYDEAGVPGLILPNFTGVVALKDSNDHIVTNPLNSVNMDRWTNHMVLFNNYRGSSTRTNEWGTECLVAPISEWCVNDTVMGVVEAMEVGYDPAIKDMDIPAGKFVLSGNGSSDTFLRNYCHVGDTVKIVQGLLNTSERLTQLIGGGPWILRNGTDVTASSTENLGSSFYAVRHPRTAVGFNSDSTRAYFMVVDGRNEHSVGMTCHEVGAFLKSLGAMNVLNLDGGGSSTFTVRSEVKNIPSDGWERIVANALMCVSSAPDSDLAIVQIERDSIAVYKNNTFDVPMSGWDVYYNPKAIPSGSGLIIDHTEGLGAYSDGKFTVSEQDMDGCIYTDLNGVLDSMKVHIISIDSLSSYPADVVTDSLKTIEFYVYGAKDGGRKELLDNSIFEFELLDETIGSIDENGVFTPIKRGETELVVHYGQASDTAYISVQCAYGEVPLQEMEDEANWTLTGENLDTNLTAMQFIDHESVGGNKAIRVDYTTTDDGEINLEVTPQIVYGIPSEFLIDAASDGLNHRLYLVFDDANGNEYRYKAAGYFNNEGFEAKSISIEAIIPGDGGEYYPMTLKAIHVNLANGIQSGTLYFDRIRCVYPGWTSIKETGEGAIPSEFALMQNYPNPFNPMTSINYSLSRSGKVDLVIYDINGKKVASLVDEFQEAGVYTLDFDASYLPGGVYFYRLQADNWSNTKKMLLIK